MDFVISSSERPSLPVAGSASRDVAVRGETLRVDIEGPESLTTTIV